MAEFDMTKIPGNSNASKNASTGSKSIVNEGVRILNTPPRKPLDNKFAKFVEEYLGGDIRDIKDYIIKKVIVPGVKKSVYVMGCSILGSFLGENGTGISNPAGLNPNIASNFVNFRGFFNGTPNQSTQMTVPGNNASISSYDNLYFNSPQDAENVLAAMYDIIEKSDAISVAELMDLVGQPSMYTQRSYGWTDIKGARIEETPGGYHIHLPRASVLK